MKPKESVILTGIVENCHLKSQILPQTSPNFATEIEKFATFCQKNYKILQIELNNRITFFFVPGDPEYNIDPKMHTKSHSGAYQKEDQNLKRMKERHQNFNYTRYP